MAEAIAAIGIVASIIQLVDFSSRVLRRLDELQTNLGEIPVSLRHIQVQLPLLKDTLQQTSAAIDAGSVPEATKKALIPAIEGCTQQIGLLDPILDNMLATTTDRRLKILTKTMSSLRQEPKIESIMKILRCYVATLTFYYAAMSSTLQPLTDEKLTQIRQWLSPPDPSLNYQKALKRRQAGTGLWLLESSTYTAWKTDPGSFLWLYGIPGCGKTVLSSTILQSVSEYCADDVGKVVAYFYFDFNDTQKQSPEAMCTQEPRDAVFLLWEWKSTTLLDSLLETMRSIIQEFPQSYIVLDALDECTQRAELMDILERVAEWKLGELHVLVTSRKEHEIERSLESIVTTQNTICLQSDVVDGDISTYVRERLSDDKSLSKWQKDPQSRHQIETVLMNGAHGMFRWAACQLDTLGKCRNRAALRKSLETLPQTLDETYERILCAIDKADSKLADRILRWLAFAARPLRLEEIAEVAAIDVERSPAFDREEVLEDPLEVSSICSSLVTITRTEVEGRTTKVVIALAHYSVKEYLCSERILQSRAAQYGMQEIAGNEFIARGCIGYLSQFQTLDSLSEQSFQESKLAVYTSEFWITHTHAAAPETETLDRLIMEFLTVNKTYQNWARIYNPQHTWQSPMLDRELAKVPAPLYYASFSGLVNIVALLALEDGTDINAQTGDCGTALYAASIKGHDKIVELLRSYGADINAGGAYYGTALQVACVYGHDKIVKLLLDYGADIDAGGCYWGTALQLACVYGHDKIVELLLSHGADINAGRGHYGRGHYGSALEGASINGHDTIVKLLLDHGACQP